MLSLHMRHVATGITVDLKDITSKNGNTLTADLRNATMQLIDKVAVEKHMPVVEAMSNSQVEIIAKWEVNNAKPA